MAVHDPESRDRPSLAEQRTPKGLMPVGKEPPGFGPGGSARLYTMPETAQARTNSFSTKL